MTANITNNIKTHHISHINAFVNFYFQVKLQIKKAETGITDKTQISKS